MRQEKLRQKSGWFHWVVQGKSSDQLEGDSSESSSSLPMSVAGNSGSASIAPSDASDVGGVR